MNEEEEPGICACCRAATNGLFDEAIPVCEECYKDGTFQTWLVAELEKAALEMGMVSRVDEKGRTLWSDPAP